MSPWDTLRESSTLLLPDPITQESSANRSRWLSTAGQGQSRSKFRTLCDVFQAFGDTRCRLSEWLIPKLDEVVPGPSDDCTALKSAQVFVSTAVLNVKTCFRFRIAHRGRGNFRIP